jgi:hypothetical protein
MANLTQGALGRIQSGADVSEPIVQVLKVVLNPAPVCGFVPASFLCLCK